MTRDKLSTEEHCFSTVPFLFSTEHTEEHLQQCCSFFKFYPRERQGQHRGS